MNREQIYAALFALLQPLKTAGTVATLSRRLRHWSDLGAREQPALFMAQKHETAQRLRGQPPKWTLLVDLWVYCNAPDDLTPTDPTMNGILDAIETALAPTGKDFTTVNAQTLGGLVSHCFIAGQVETGEGLLGGQAFAIVPIEILAPGAIG